MAIQPKAVTPKVTVLIASYNRLPMLQSAVASALGQTYTSFEVLVIDDGSDAPTVKWLRSAASAEARMRVQFQTNQGVAIARQNGLLSALGDLVCILDSDDRLDRDYLQNVMEVFARDPALDLVYCNYFSVTGERVHTVRLPKYRDNQAMLRGIFLRPKVPLKHSGTTFRKQVAIRVGGYDRTLPAKVDIDLYMKFLVADRKVFLLENPLVEFVFHRNSISRKRWLGIKVWLTLIDRYGPRSSLVRMYYKIVRCAAEAGKRLCEAMWFRRPASTPASRLHPPH